jgi:pimeloyl-ACP methyl ester carboxylesterase
MADQEKRADLSRRSFIAGSVVTMATSGAPANAQSGKDNINTRVLGTQDPTLIFVHGYTCALDDWDAQVKALSPRFRCVALDLPGHGVSAKPEAVSIATMGDAVKQVKERVGARASILVGHSMGCRVIIDAFLKSQSGVVGLVFVDGSIIGGDPETGIQRVKDSISRDGMDALTQRLFTDMFIEGSDPALRDRLVARAKAVDPAFREELFVDLVRWDLTKAREAIKQITVPALVLQSTYVDSNLKRVPLRAGMTTPWMDAIASSVAKSEAKIVPNAGHFAMIEGAQFVNEEIDKFAARLA